MADKIKGVLISLCSAVASFLGALTIPVILLVASNVIDYVTAFLACKYQGVKFTSDKSLKGIIKKILMWLLVVVGVIVDQMLMYVSNNMHVSVPFKYLIGCIVAIWLICNELISILENIAGAGVALPPFLKPIIEATKAKLEDNMEENKNE